MHPPTKLELYHFLFFTKVDAEDGAESVQATVSSGTSNITSINEVDSHSETASSGYASVQGADESVLEEHAPSESKYIASPVLLDGIVLPLLVLCIRFFSLCNIQQCLFCGVALIFLLF